MLALITALVGSGILSVIKKVGDALLHSKYISAQAIFDKFIIDCVHCIPRAYTKMAANPQAQRLGSQTASTSSMSTMFSKMMSTGSKFVMEGVKSFVVGKKVSFINIRNCCIYIMCGTIIFL